MENAKSLIRYVRKYNVVKKNFSIGDVFINTVENGQPVFVDLKSRINLKNENSFITVINRSTKKIGVLTSVKGEDGIVRIGWSRCYHSEWGKDKYDPEKGKRLAKERAIKGYSVKIPNSIVSEAVKFAHSAAKYYKVNPEEVVIVGLTEDTFRK